MNTDFLDPAVLSVGSLLQLAVFVLLVRKRVFASLPTFVIYNGYSFTAGILGLSLVRLSPEARLWLWIVATICETFFNLLVLRELGKVVLRFNSIIAGSRLPIIFLFLISLVILWPAVQWQISLAAYPFIWRFALHLSQATTMIQAAAFGTLVGWSSLKKLRWPNLEFRFATGMGIWTAVSLAALMLHNDGLIGGNNHWVDLLTPVSTLFVMAWWAHFLWFEPLQVQEMQDSKVLELAGGDAEDEDSNHTFSASS